jgi:hypothetical protein
MPFGGDQPAGIGAIAVRHTVPVVSGKEVRISTWQCDRIKGLTSGSSPLPVPPKQANSTVRFSGLEATMSAVSPGFASWTCGQRCPAANDRSRSSGPIETRDSQAFVNRPTRLTGWWCD